ncbi:uncharacterized protein LOC131626572 [Vicia villosa]|uniref:uncharacterized protein LOC131626572 n=1 Tax=Vicia villosa TaxID=3911 RepID=UPI00273B0B7A|nr:uncharacterized protein LOC131626572 [Vicia villosa]
MRTRSAARIVNNDHSDDFVTIIEEDVNDRTAAVGTEEAEDGFADMRNKKGKRTSSNILHRNMRTRSAARIDNNDHTAAVGTEEEDLNDHTGAVGTEEEEDGSADMRNKKGKKTSSRILHRCFPKKLTELVLLLNEGKKDPRKKEDCIKKEKYITECGFGGLLKLNITIIPGVFVSWILDNFDEHRGMIVNENARITVGEEDVKRVYDLPRGKKIIDLEKVDKSSKEKVKKFKEQLGYIGETYDSMIHIHTNVLYEKLMNFEITKNKAWAKGFILLAIGTILCPTTSYLISLNYATVLSEVKKVSSYNWCQHLIQHANGGIKKDACSGKADFHFLLVHFLDMVQTTKQKEIVEKAPSCGNWEDGNVSMELKKIKKKGGFNKVIILDKQDCDIPESSMAAKDMGDEVRHDKIAETAKRSREKVIQRKGKKRKTQNVDDEMMEAHLAPQDYALEEAKKQIKICDEKLKFWADWKTYWVKQAEEAESSMRKGKEVGEKEHRSNTEKEVGDKEDAAHEPRNASPELVESEDNDSDHGLEEQAANLVDKEDDAEQPGKEDDANQPEKESQEKHGDTAEMNDSDWGQPSFSLGFSTPISLEESRKSPSDVATYTLMENIPQNEQIPLPKRISALSQYFRSPYVMQMKKAKLSEEDTQLVNYAWTLAEANGGAMEVLFQDKCKMLDNLNRGSLFCLKKDCKLEGDVIGNYFSFLNKKEMMKGKMKRLIFPVTYEFEHGVKITRRKKDHREAHVVAEYAEDLIRQLKYMDFNDIDVENPEYWFFPVYLKSHYAAYVIDFKEQRFGFLNSCERFTFRKEDEWDNWGKWKVRYGMELINAKRNEPIDFSQWSWEDVNLPLQHDRKSCGLFVLTYIEKWDSKQAAIWDFFKHWDMMTNEEQDDFMEIQRVKVLLDILKREDNELLQNLTKLALTLAEEEAACAMEDDLEKEAEKNKKKVKTKKSAPNLGEEEEECSMAQVLEKEAGKKTKKPRTKRKKTLY